MKTLLTTFLLLSLFFEGFAQTCPVPPACTDTNTETLVFDNTNNTLCLLAGTFDLATIQGAMSGNNTATIYVAPGVIVNADAFSVNLNGNSKFQVINEGTWNQGSMSLKTGDTFNNCLGAVLNGDNLTITSEGVFNNLGTANYTGSVRNNHSDGYIYNAGIFNIGGNFTNNGTICGPDDGCGVFGVDGTASNPAGSFGAEEVTNNNYVDCGNLDICDGNGTTFDITDDEIGSGVTSCTCLSFLPVELLSFTSEINQNYISINWETTSETDNDYFFIEKSRDGKGFEAIGRVEGNGTSTAIQKYEFIDDEVQEGINYYRLNQIDYDGTSNLSKVIASYFTNSLNLRFEIFPNPSNGASFHLKIRHLKEVALKAKVIIYSSQGQVVFSNDLVLDGRDIEIQKNLAQGSYFVELVGRDFNLKKRLMVH